MKKRVVCLYRVSTRQQVDNQDDIPMQRRECMDFIARMPDWVFIDERLEKGVSGFKVSASKRDAIQEIRKMAELKQFDVLLVFMFDRLGRRDDETPFLVEWFVQHGIEVWSTREGQQRLESRGDKLMNYIRYWMAGGESEKTSLRVKASHTQMTQDGIWRGGGIPYGYKTVRNGRIGKKNRELFDLEIDEIQGPRVQEVFHLLTQEGMGSLRIANEMNRRYPDPKKVWTAQTVRTMVRNPIYTGRMHMNDITSAPIESLRIISDSDFSFTQYCLKTHISNRYKEIREQENAMVPEGETKASVYGATLLSGLLYCGHCGCRLVGGYCTKQRKDGPYRRPIYRCYNSSLKAKECKGQTVYSAMKIEKAVLDAIRDYFNRIRQTINGMWQEQATLNLRKSNAARVKQIQETLEKLHKDENNLNEEILKALSGQSQFPAATLAELLNGIQQKKTDAENQLQAAKNDGKEEIARIKEMEKKFQEILDWAAEFDKVDTKRKKMILSRMIEKITVDRNYNITIHFFLSQEDFMNTEEATVEVANHVSMRKSKKQIANAV